MRNKKIVIGVSSFSYLEKRNFTDLPYSNVKFKKRINVFSITNKFNFHIRKKINPNFQFSFRDFNPLGVNGHHLFSSVSFSKKPWMVTSSVPVPRWTKNFELGYKQLAAENCKKIILISKTCLNRQLELIEDTKYAASIKPKIIFLPPSQPKLINDYKEKPLQENVITFILVGHQIMIKGGWEVLNTFKKLHNQGAPVKLSIISLLHDTDYLSNPIIKKRLSELKSMINTRPPFLEYFPQLPNIEVLKKIKASHVSLLPSYGDTFGYSVLESQASGCPVISTNTIALPEINNNDMGWIIPVPITKHGKPDAYSEKKYLEFSECIERGLENTIVNILSEPEKIKFKGENALRNIEMNYSPIERAQTLENIYKTHF